MRRIAQSSSFRCPTKLPPAKFPVSHYRLASSQPHSQQKEPNQSQDPKNQASEVTAKEKSKKKSMAELDVELQQKMSGLSGDGGEAGIEYEDGKPVAMKRSVKNNMFRYI
ncbi:hypothetical protein F5Y13DRAFT_161270 [Hypoxylon sp. FL1857]|nr:hypothetical protein F5Y13DRAFT_161270 [Hypoxylon sp. FL1857]